MSPILFCALLAWGASPAGPDWIAEFLEAFRAAAARPLWPGFDPASIPLLLSDGEESWLVGHPSPPTGFAPLSGLEGVSRQPGHHPDVRANTSIVLDEVPTATLWLDPLVERPTEEWVAICMHECFHVHQRRVHAGWRADELRLITWPLEAGDELAWRRLESMALEQAVSTAEARQAAAQARAALELRARRYGLLAPEDAACERGIELIEGLARYVQDRVQADPKPGPQFTEHELEPERVRERAYASGSALARLLDRFDPGWQERLDDRPGTCLDGLLERALPEGVAAAAVSEAELESARAAAEVDLQALRRRRARERAQLLDAPGLRIVFVARPGEPLGVERFDPLNLARGGDLELFHRRWLKLAGSRGRIEVLERPCLTRGAGLHPLFDGVAELIVPGLEEEPEVFEDGDRLALRARGLTVELRGVRLEAAETVWTVHL